MRNIAYAILVSSLFWISISDHLQAARFWPLRTGQQYTFDRRDPLDNTWQFRLTVDAQMSHNSLDYFHLGALNYDNDGRYEDNGQIRSTETQVYGYNPDGAEYLEFQTGPAGTKWSIYQPNDEYNYKVVEIVAVEPVTVPYGTFSESYKFRKYRCVDPDELGLGQSPDWYEWIVPGIGQVRQEDYCVDGPAPVIMELTGLSQSPDLSGNCTVNLEDLAAVARWWLAYCGASDEWCGGADLNFSGRADLSDLAESVIQWAAERNISDHVFEIELETAWDHESPDVTSDDTFDFELDIMTDDTVIGMEFTTPAGHIFAIPYDSYVDELPRMDGLLTLGREYDWDTGWYEWTYEYEFFSQSSLAVYGDGLYTFTVYYSDGCQQQTTAWFGIPGTTDPLPQPTQQPFFTSFDNGDIVTSPVTFTWQPCTEPAVQQIYLEYDGQGSFGDYILSADATGLDLPIEMSEDAYEVYLGFEVIYDSQNSDGILVRTVKYSESDYQITVVNNTAPVVNAGSDQIILLPAVAHLDGTVTDDGLPNPPGIVTALWTKESGPGTVTFVDANSVDTTASFSEAGTYVLRLTANDNQLTAYDEVTIMAADEDSAFVTTWNTALGTGTTVTLALAGTVNAAINWGDGTVTAVTWSGPHTHDYGTDGIYTVAVIGSVTAYNNSSNGGTVSERQKLVSVDNWGQLGFTSLRSAFADASNLISVPTSSDGIEAVTDMAWMFYNASAFNGYIGSWDTTNVTNMVCMFYNASAFNQNIGGWNTSNVTLMGEMFREASAFNQPIGGWNTANVTNMRMMFYEASAFNQPIGDWNTAKVTDMSYMFAEQFGVVSAFNQDINNWDTSKVTNMSYMFYNASTFNQPIGGWNTSNVTDMRYMFDGASAFNQNIGGWNTSKVIDMRNMFRGVPAFNQPIGGWNTSKVTNMRNMFAGASVFNQNIASWDTSNVTDMSWMFASASMFNQNISGWNTTKVTDMRGMFSMASVFNQDLSGWCVTLIPSKPISFDYGATAWTLPRPNWGDPCQ